MKKELKVCFSAGVKYKGLYFLAATYMNALFLYDENNEKLTFLTNFENEKKKEDLYVKAFLYKNEAWFIPRQAEYIAIVNLDNYRIEYMPLIYQKHLYESFKYIDIVCFKDDYLCLIPNCVDASMIIDLKRKKAKAYYNIITSRRNYSSAIFLDDKIYFYPLTEEKILVLDLITDERIELPWMEQKEAFGKAVYDKNLKQIFHAPLIENNILIEDLCNQKNKKEKCFEWNDKKYRTYYSSENKDDIFFWGHEKRIVLRINKKNHQKKIYSINNVLDGKCFFPIGSMDIEALIYGENCIIQYNAEKDSFEKKYICTTYEKLKKEINEANINISDIISEFTENENIENITLGLNQFICFIENKSEEKKLYYSKSGIGYEIYRKLTKNKEI